MKWEMVIRRYPTLAMSELTGPGSATPATAGTERARALQAEAARLLNAGQMEAALARLAELVGDPGLRNAVSAQGALIVPNAQWLMVKLLGSTGSAVLQPALETAETRAKAPRDFQTLTDLIARLNDYADAAMSSGQRRFLMHELAALAPNPSGRSLLAGDGSAESPASRLLQMLAAEELAADYLERDLAPVVAGVADPGPASARPATFQRTSLAGVWRLPGADRSVVALFHQQRLRAELEKHLAPFVLPDARVTVFFPSAALDAHPLALARGAGELLPGWRLALGFRHIDPFAEASALQTRLYLWTGVGVVAIIAVVALLVARYVAAQVRLARMKNELVSTVSHELKTPLASMRALVDTLSAGRYRDEAQLRDYLSLMARENLRLSHLIENFLAFSRMERGQQQLSFVELSPQEVVRAALDALGERLAASACDFTTHLAPGLPPIRADADALTSVLVNLLDNACKYTNGEKRIAVRVLADGAHVVFEVADNGVGIAREEQRRIFEQFYQVDQSLTRQRGGCGLGLSIVDHIVRAHGGTIDVESEPGCGSVFRVKIPVANRDPKFLPQRAQSSEREHRVRREGTERRVLLRELGLDLSALCDPTRMNADKILIIEDDPTMQRVLKDNFEFSGFAVRAVGDGAKALPVVAEFKPDLIVLDVMLLGVSGFDLCRRIRQGGLATPIVMLTSKSQESDVVLGLNLGADDYVTKLLSLDVLLARVNACLRRRRPANGGAVEFGDCRLDPAAHKLFRGGVELALTPKEYRLLDHFVINAGRALTRQRILDAVWGEDLIVTERSVDRCINTLRQKIEPDPEHPRFIKTIRDVGYRFEV